MASLLFFSHCFTLCNMARNPTDVIPKEDRPELGAEVIKLILQGVQLRDAVAQVGISVDTFAKIMDNHRSVALAYGRAREIQADLEVDEALKIADTEPDAAKARNQIDIRKWRASKHRAKVYGERIDVNVQQTIDISATLREAKTRLIRPVYDQLTNEQAQTLEIKGLQIPRPTDSQSDDLIPNNAAPDIFG